MTATQQSSRNVITLKGSTKVVTEFFQIAVSSILFQRGIYPTGDFASVKKYGVHVLVAKNEDLVKYLAKVTAYFQDWLARGQLQRMALVIMDSTTNEALEKWTFKVNTDRELVAGTKPLPQKSDAEVSREIAAIIRQITSSITFLPLLHGACTFDIQIHTEPDAPVPREWADSKEANIRNSTDIALRSFSTKVHNVSAFVTFRQDDGVDEEDVSDLGADAGGGSKGAEQEGNLDSAMDTQE